MKNSKMKSRGLLTLLLLMVFLIFVYLVLGQGGDSNSESRPSKTIVEETSINKNVPGELETADIFFNDKKIKVELAKSDEERSKGLSNRVSLNKGDGMLFIFQKDGYYSFWMKDTLFPIDIIWINSNKEVVYIKHNAMPESFPEPFVSEDLARYVLEVPAGYSREEGIEVGTLFIWE